MSAKLPWWTWLKFSLVLKSKQINRHFFLIQILCSLHTFISITDNSKLYYNLFYMNVNHSHKNIKYKKLLFQLWPRSVIIKSFSEQLLGTRIKRHNFRNLGYYYINVYKINIYNSSSCKENLRRIQAPYPSKTEYRDSANPVASINVMIVNATAWVWLNTLHRRVFF